MGEYVQDFEASVAQVSTTSEGEIVGVFLRWTVAKGEMQNKTQEPEDMIQVFNLARAVEEDTNTIQSLPLRTGFHYRSAGSIV
ncbi:peroxidase 64 [Sesbania bispinosa]|nr:peroxidase 64 [Sesbania bispinosa]